MKKKPPGKWEYVNLSAIGACNIRDENGNHVCSVTKEKYAKIICEAVNKLREGK